MYDHFKAPQEYFTNKMFSFDDMSLLFSMRSKTVKGFLDNFKYLQKENDLCILCEKHIDSQEFLFKCEMITSKVEINSNIKYYHIYGTVSEQKQVVTQFKKCLDVWKILTVL